MKKDKTMGEEIAFNEIINDVMKSGLELNLIAGGTSRDLKNLVFDLDGSINAKMNPKTNAIDERKQIRQVEELKKSTKYLNLVKGITKIQTTPGWADLVENTQITFSNENSKRVLKAFTTII